MILYITRKYPPSVGGMQKVNAQLHFYLSQLSTVHLIAWGGSQKWLALVIPYLLLKSLFLIRKHPDIKMIFLGDALLSPIGLFLKMVSGKRVVAMACGLDITWSFFLYQWIVPRCLGRLDKAICISQGTKEECLKRKIPLNRLSVINIGIDIKNTPKPMNRNEATETLKGILPSAGKYDKVILSVGRIVERKGFHVFIEKTFPQIVEKHPDVIYLIAGDGPHRNVAAANIRNRKLQNHAYLLGRVTEEELEALYSLANIFVMPNIKVENDMEGFGLVILEAGLHKIPVVASRLEGIKDAIKDPENGILVRHSNYNRFARKISEILSDPEKQKHLGESAKDFVTKTYCFEKVAGKYFNEFKTLIQYE